MKNSYKKIKQLKVIDIIKPIETGTMNTVDYKRSKKKIIKGIAPF